MVSPWEWRNRWVVSKIWATCGRWKGVVGNCMQQRSFANRFFKLSCSPNNTSLLLALINPPTNAAALRKLPCNCLSAFCTHLVCYLFFHRCTTQDQSTHTQHRHANQHAVHVICHNYKTLNTKLTADDVNEITSMNAWVETGFCQTSVFFIQCNLSTAYPEPVPKTVILVKILVKIGTEW